eukprot:scaffold110060_cov48-Phaeocystis_antarctica.AAC.2
MVVPHARAPRITVRCLWIRVLGQGRPLALCGVRVQCRRSAVSTAPDARGTIRARVSHDPRLRLEGENRTSVPSRSRKMKIHLECMIYQNCSPTDPWQRTAHTHNDHCASVRLSVCASRLGTRKKVSDAAKPPEEGKLRGGDGVPAQGQGWDWGWGQGQGQGSGSGSGSG